MGRGCSSRSLRKGGKREKEMWFPRRGVGDKIMLTYPFLRVLWSPSAF